MLARGEDLEDRRGRRHLGQRLRPPAGENAGKFEPLSLAQIAAKASETGGPIGAGTQLNTIGAEGGFSTHIADVEVDPATGCTRVIRMTCFQDVGRAIHPDYVEGQLQGAMAQAIGWALSEEYIYNKRGQLDNPGFLDYRMPVASDLPMLECGIIEIPNPKHPQGVKGVGEVPRPVLAAVRNAVQGDRHPLRPPADVAAEGARGDGIGGRVGSYARGRRLIAGRTILQPERRPPDRVRRAALAPVTSRIVARAKA